MQQLIARLTALINAIGLDVKTIYGYIGSMSNLTTSAKASIVAAINEINSRLTNTATINDSSPSATNSYSSSKVDTLIAGVKSDILGGASPAFDTLKELRDQMITDETAASAMLTAIGNRVAYDAPQSLTNTQQTQARTNIAAYGLAEIGDPNTDLVALYTTAKA